MADAAEGPRSRWLDSATGQERACPTGGGWTHDPLRDLDAVLGAWRAPRAAASGGRGGWLGYFSYDLGRWIEPTARHAGRGGPGGRGTAWPLIELHRIDAPEPSGSAAEVAGWLDAAGLGVAGRDASGPLELDAWRSRTGRAEFERQAARVIEYIRAGDMFQANLSHVLEAELSGAGATDQDAPDQHATGRGAARGADIAAARALFATLAVRARPWHGAYIELAGWAGESAAEHSGGGGGTMAVASLSPELFLSIEPEAGGGARRIVTRPMKGTRPGSARAEELRASAKDRAELAMIVDLMRNDLGRVCRLGSVRVPAARSIERHGADVAGGVWQATATVEGELRAGVTLGGVLRATFPPGSVTGAPKIRAMQVIDELEPHARGPYCGAIGWIGDDGAVELGVAIRTLLVSRGRGGLSLAYPVGAGVVVDSDPAEEWRETLAKAGVLEALRAGRDGAHAGRAGGRPPARG